MLYNKFMGGVDHHDQFRSHYKLCSKSRKFYTYNFWFLRDVCIINAFLLMRHFRANTQSKLSHIKHLRVKLAKSLIGNYNSCHKYSLPSKVREVAKQPGYTVLHSKRVDFFCKLACKVLIYLTQNHHF